MYLPDNVGNYCEIRQLEPNMMQSAVTFLIVAIVAGFLGLSGIAGVATKIAWIVFLVALVMAVISFLRRSI